MVTVQCACGHTLLLAAACCVCGARATHSSGSSSRLSTFFSPAAHTCRQPLQTRSCWPHVPHNAHTATGRRSAAAAAAAAPAAAAPTAAGLSALAHVSTQRVRCCRAPPMRCAAPREPPTQPYHTLTFAVCGGLCCHTALLQARQLCWHAQRPRLVRAATHRSRAAVCQHRHAFEGEGVWCGLMVGWTRVECCERPHL
jgi:hypothetical protein